VNKKFSLALTSLAVRRAKKSQRAKTVVVAGKTDARVADVGVVSGRDSAGGNPE